jgi:hypothetical protein
MSTCYHLALTAIYGVCCRISCHQSGGCDAFQLENRRDGSQDGPVYLVDESQVSSFDEWMLWFLCKESMHKPDQTPISKNTALDHGSRKRIIRRS